MRHGPWLVVGTSVRALVQSAARHGHAVCAIDAYADRDTLQACAGRALRVPLDAQDRIGAPELRAAIQTCAQRHAPLGFRGIVAGSGLDSAHDVRTLLAQTAPLCGCAAPSVERLRDPCGWVDLLRQLDLPHPATVFAPPPQWRGWLTKQASGTGGLHVRPWRRGAAPAPDAYFQRRSAGRCASLLFAAEQGRVFPIGWQWQLLAPVPAWPWRYGGVLTAADMPPPAQARVLNYLQRIATALPLRGVGSLDFLLDGECVSLLELNPRPTASVALYPHLDLFGMHVGFCAPASVAASAVSGAPARGECILYATGPLRVDAHFNWPHWCADIPAGDSIFADAEAVCSVQACAATVRGLRLRLSRRRQQLARALRAGQFQDEHRDCVHQACFAPSHEPERQCAGAAAG